MSPNADALDDRKSYATLAAQFALAGQELRREVGIDGSEHLYAVLRGLSTPLDNLKAARELLAQMGTK